MTKMAKLSTSKVFQNHERCVVPLPWCTRKRSNTSFVLLKHIFEAVEVSFTMWVFWLFDCCSGQCPGLYLDPTWFPAMIQNWCGVGYQKCADGCCCVHLFKTLSCICTHFVLRLYVIQKPQSCSKVPTDASNLSYCLYIRGRFDPSLVILSLSMMLDLGRSSNLSIYTVLGKALFEPSLRRLQQVNDIYWSMEMWKQFHLTMATECVQECHSRIIRKGHPSKKGSFIVASMRKGQQLHSL
jgi:hypothetical protein